MAMTTFNQPQHQTEEAARQWFETLRWPDGVVCPHCGSVGRAYARSKPGLYRCAEKECRKDFTVRTKSVLESSHIPLRLWAQAFTLLCSSKKGMSAHQVHRTLNITYKSAWFLCHRIREAMRTGGLAPMGGSGKTVEADETYFGTIPKDEIMPRTIGRGKTKVGKRAGIRRPAYRAVFALVERGGQARTFHIAQADQNTVHAIMKANIERETRIHTDESNIYNIAPWHFEKHETIKHKVKEYARGDVTTNSVEGYFSVFKRGMKGVYQHCAEKHLHRYLSEFDFRFNHRVALGFGDGERAALAVKGAAGKRLTYRQSH
jgi:transposase-like protein